MDHRPCFNCFMKLVIASLWAAGVLRSEFVYQDAINDIYCDTDKKYFSANLDGNQVMYVDFETKTVVNTLPDFVDPVSWDIYYLSIMGYAENEMNEFRENMDYITRQYHHPAEANVPPVSAMYAHDEVHLGSENTLICYITGFYPPQLMVRWERNNKGMTRGLNSSQLHINSDGSFYQFFTLKFTCTVEHQALDKPLTRFWGVEVSEPTESLGPAVFCGVGLTVGLLGVATGTFFFIKGKTHGSNLEV